MQNIFVEFLPPWVETGLQPAFYDKESGTVLQQTARMYAKVNELVESVNHQNETIADYIEQFNTLHDYVHDYFDNLDVQEEINNKLNQMAQNGSLTELIKSYIDPIQDAYEAEVDAKINLQNDAITQQNQNIEVITAKVDATVSGSPRGVYATVSDLTTANPDHKYIYIVNEDGKWYYYNTSTSSWTAGGVYQSALGVIPYNDTNNLVDKTTVSAFHSLTTQGVLEERLTYSTTDYIPVEGSTKYTILSPWYRYVYFDSDKQVVTGGADVVGWSSIPTTITTPATASYIRIVFYSYVTEMMFAEGELSTKDYEEFSKQEVNGIDLSESNYVSIDEHINNILYSGGTVNLLDESKIYSGAYIAVNGGLTALANYQTTPLIKVAPSTAYYINKRQRFRLEFDENQMPIQSTYHSDGWLDAGTLTTSADTHYVAFTFNVNDTDIMFNIGSSAIAYQPYNPQLKQTLGLTTKMREEIGEYTAPVTVLSNKKLVACGDSFTQYTNATFDSGVYAGENKVWPFLIGLRNNMTVENMAVSGSTMTMDDSNDHQHFSDTLYTQIPADADYIIIKYGINDVNFSSPLGTISDNTNRTFYGAWNVVLSYIIENHPLAKIGIIVTNGLAFDNSAPNKSYYANAIIEIAKLYGIPTLNEWNDPNVPLLNRSGRSDVKAEIKNIRNTTFRVSPTNTHENWQCQEYESTFIEDFLKRL